jgi:hypothetical protein
MSGIASSPASLLDGNVLVALSHSHHVHHEPARRWFAARAGLFATCPITQGTLLRTLVQLGACRSVAEAEQVRRVFCAHARHVFWAADLPFDRVSMRGVQGHRQVTDAYLAALARHRGGRLATFDRGLAALHADVAELIESAAPGQP